MKGKWNIRFISDTANALRLKACGKCHLRPRLIAKESLPLQYSI